MKIWWPNSKWLVTGAVAGLMFAPPILGQEKGNSSSASQFESPVRLEAGDKPIKVEAPGYACPTVADVDGDGQLDLVVGQFNQGHMQFFKNLAGAGELPRLAAAEWLKTGEERAIVPGVW